MLDAEAGFLLFDKRLFETLTFGKRDHGVLALTDNEDVIFTRGEGTALGVLDVSDIV